MLVLITNWTIFLLLLMNSIGNNYKVLNEEKRQRIKFLDTRLLNLRK